MKTIEEDVELEKAIDAIGRDRVFTRAKDYGWGADLPPKWIWWGIVNELRNETDAVR